MEIAEPAALLPAPENLMHGTWNHSSNRCSEDIMALFDKIYVVSRLWDYNLSYTNLYFYYWPAYTQCRGGGKLLTVAGVCRRHRL